MSNPVEPPTTREPDRPLHRCQSCERIAAREGEPLCDSCDRAFWKGHYENLRKDVDAIIELVTWQRIQEHGLVGAIQAITVERQQHAKALTDLQTALDASESQRRSLAGALAMKDEQIETLQYSAALEKAGQQAQIAKLRDALTFVAQAFDPEGGCPDEALLARIQAALC